LLQFQECLVFVLRDLNYRGLNRQVVLDLIQVPVNIAGCVTSDLEEIFAKFLACFSHCLWHLTTFTEKRL